jgi:phosphomannomutase/phosphoglucomutase
MTRLFGTNGIRWTVGEEKSGEFAIRLGLAIGTNFGRDSKLCIGIDSRTTSPLVFNAVSSGLMACGCDIVDLGLVPTPVVQYAIPGIGANGGLVVTASHNPPEFNGLKCLAKDGTELSRDDEILIEETYSKETFARVDWESVGKLTTETAIQSTYKRDMSNKYPLPEGKCLRVVVDCANGTAGPFSPEILKDIGCKVSTLNAQPDGRFPGRLPEPIKENISSLMTAVKNEGADFGLAHDGDVDRAIFVDEKGDYVTGDQSLALFAAEAIERSGGGSVVVPVNTSKMVSDVVTAKGGKIDYTPIGSPFIARHVKKTGAVLGGEGNGGVIFPKHQFCRDGMMTGVRMAQILTSKKMALSKMIKELPEYHLMREKLAIAPGLSKESLMDAVKATADGEVITIDGVKMLFDDYWVLVRLSGTESFVRVTVESDSITKASSILSQNTKMVKELIDSLSS